MVETNEKGNRPYRPASRLIQDGAKRIPTLIKPPQKIIIKFSYHKKFRNRKFQTAENILRSSPSLEGYVSDLYGSSLY